MKGAERRAANSGLLHEKVIIAKEQVIPIAAKQGVIVPRDWTAQQEIISRGAGQRGIVEEKGQGNCPFDKKRFRISSLVQGTTARRLQETPESGQPGRIRVLANHAQRMHDAADCRPRQSFSQILRGGPQVIELSYSKGCAWLT